MNTIAQILLAGLILAAPAFSAPIDSAMAESKAVVLTEVPSNTAAPGGVAPFNLTETLANLTNQTDVVREQLIHLQNVFSKKGLRGVAGWFLDLEASHTGRQLGAAVPVALAQTMDSTDESSDSGDSSEPGNTADDSDSGVASDFAESSRSEDGETEDSEVPPDSKRSDEATPDEPTA